MQGEELRPTRFDIAVGGLYGASRASLRLDSRSSETPLEALASEMLPALEDPPCFVAFSGGRDSSAVLAAATFAARRESLPDPIPLTLSHPGCPDADETEWQELVVRHLGISDWHRRKVAAGESDFVGPWASRVLGRHGVLYPPNAFSIELMLSECAGNSLITGQGGDALFEAGHWAQIQDVAGRRTRPVPKDALRAAFAISPVGLRELVYRRRTKMSFGWLRPEALAKLNAAAAAEQAEEPARWSARLVWQTRRRHQRAASWSLELLARDAGKRLVHPLIGERFVASLIRAGGWTGYGDRTALMRALFGSLLPDSILSRSTKAAFQDVFWSAPSRDFFQTWRGEGVDPELVDWESLSRELREPVPMAAIAMLVQAGWLAHRPSDRTSASVT